jgi:GNAT superfamily N-acetyltransferase
MKLKRLLRQSVIDIPQAISTNFGQCIEELSGLSELKHQHNESVSWFASGLPHPMYSYAYAESDVTEIDLNQCIKELKSTNSPFFFCDGLARAGKKNEAMFAKYDLQSFGNMDGMSFDLSREIPATHPSIECNIRRVETAEDYIAFAEVMAEAAGLNKDLGPRFFSSFSKYEDSSIVASTAYVDGRPVGCSLVFMPEGDVAGNYFDWVLPDFRKQGVNSAMVIHRLHIAKATGYKFLIAQCMDTSTRLYAHLGFENVCKLGLYGKAMWEELNTENSLS